MTQTVGFAYEQDFTSADNIRFEFTRLPLLIGDINAVLDGW